MIATKESARKAGILKNPRFGVVAKKMIMRMSNFRYIVFIILTYAILAVFLGNKLLFTPDFGESDAYHLGLSLKYYLAENLKNNTLPFWTDKLQGGFPLFAEGQIGALFLPNLIFLKFLPFPLAYNLLFVFSLFCLSFGAFLLLKSLKINVWIAFLVSFVFAFNGSVSLRWVHFNLIQTFSLFPFLFYFLLEYFKTHKKKYLLLFPLTFSQMIFAGFLPVFFLCLFGLIIWFVLYPIKQKIKSFFVLLLLILTGFLFSAVQLLPTYLLTSSASRPVGLTYEAATSMPFVPDNLWTFILPYKLGNPNIGSYPPFSADWGIFWENTPYLGQIFFFLLVIILIVNFRQIRKNKLILYYLGMPLFFLLLALGKYSPLYFVFNFPPFNFFRTPARYLLLVNFFLILTFSQLINRTYVRSNIIAKVLLCLFLLVINLELIVFTFNYHLFVDKNKILEKPTVLKSLNDGLIYSLAQEIDWNEVFIKKGWANEQDQKAYLFFKNYLYPESNLLFDKKVYGINTGGFKLKRADYMSQYIGIVLYDDKKGSLKKVINLFDLLGIKYLLTSKSITDDRAILKSSVSYKKFTVRLYQIKGVDNNFMYIPQSLKKITYVNEFSSLLAIDKLRKNESVIEGDVFDKVNNLQPPQLNHIKATQTNHSYEGNFSDKTFIAFRQIYYPDWSAYIDGKKTPLYKVNFVHSGIFVPKGNHTIVIKYENNSFKRGFFISLISLMTYLIFLWRLKPIDRDI